jgi:hypothetical protein
MSSRLAVGPTVWLLTSEMMFYKSVGSAYLPAIDLEQQCSSLEGSLPLALQEVCFTSSSGPCSLSSVGVLFTKVPDTFRFFCDSHWSLGLLPCSPDAPHYLRFLFLPFGLSQMTWGVGRRTNLLAEVRCLRPLGTNVIRRA